MTKKNDIFNNINEINKQIQNIKQEKIYSIDSKKNNIYKTKRIMTSNSLSKKRMIKIIF